MACPAEAAGHHCTQGFARAVAGAVPGSAAVAFAGLPWQGPDEHSAGGEGACGDKSGQETAD